MKLSILFAVILVSACASPTTIDLHSEKVPPVQISSRMTNAQDAVIDDFAYQVGISQSINSTSPYAWCGGSLLDHEWILTAAHCVVEHDSVVVYLGSSDRSKVEKTYTVYKKDFIIHHGLVEFPIQNDIALIRIPYTDYTKNIRNIRLPAMDENYSSYAGEKVIASGWGLESDTATSIATDLKWDRFNVISNEECYKYFSLFGLPSTVICIATSGSVSPCTGDSGGPLVLEGSNIQVGIQSFVSGAGCTKDWPAGFTRVTSFLDWIRNNTGISY